jgi:lysozyme family protein
MNWRRPPSVKRGVTINYQARMDALLLETARRDREFATQKAEAANAARHEQIERRRQIFSTWAIRRSFGLATIAIGAMAVMLIAVLPANGSKPLLYGLAATVIAVGAVQWDFAQRRMQRICRRPEPVPKASPVSHVEDHAT